MARPDQANHSSERARRRRSTLTTVELGPGDVLSRGESSTPYDVSPTAVSEDGPSTKIRKVSRACDFCKLRKSRCSGEQPCSKCQAKGRTCLYNAKYTRGRPPTPPPSAKSCTSASSFSAGLAITHAAPRLQIEDGMDIDLSTFPVRQAQPQRRPPMQSAPVSRASPELGMAEIQGQFFDPTSGMTFLHRAWKRLSAQDAQSMPETVKTSADNQPVTMAGDRPLPHGDETIAICLPSPEENRMLLKLYFDVCIATYRLVHRPSVEKWLSVVEKNLEQNKPVWHDITHSRAAIVLTALAIAKIHHEKSKGFFSALDESRAQSESDKLFEISSRLIDQETGYPKLESAQARLVQVMYLLTTSRFNKSWYVFGTALQLISAIGLHRRENPKRRRMPRTDYILTQCRLRTFWTAYMLDNYLGVVFGRPRHFHDEDIDQDFPDRVNDEDMTPTGPLDARETDDCHIDALIFHAKIGQIIGSITREVYNIRDISESERVAAARQFIQRIKDWQSSLPVHLGSVRLSMLIPSYRRQATVLKLAYSHAIMHASRLFILGNANLTHHQSHVEDCIAAARTVLETVDYMTSEGPIFHAFWWTHYVTFCALVVIYVWEIQQRRLRRPLTEGGAESRARLLELAEKCQQHLARATASNSPSRRYAVILEEFRTAATSQPSKFDGEQTNHRQVLQTDASREEQRAGVSGEGITLGNNAMEQQETYSFDPHLLDEWETTDWLDLDSSVSTTAG